MLSKDLKSMSYKPFLESVKTLFPPPTHYNKWSSARTMHFIGITLSDDFKQEYDKYMQTLSDNYSNNCLMTTPQQILSQKQLDNYNKSNTK